MSGEASLIPVNEGGQTYDQMTVASQGAIATLSRDLPIPADDTLGLTVLLQVTASPQSTSGTAKIVTVSCTGTGASLGVAFEVVGDPAKGPMLQVVDLNDAAAPAVLGPTVGTPQTLSLTFQGGMLRVSWGNQNDTLLLATSLSAQKSCTLSVGAVATAAVDGSFTADIVRACFDL